MRGKESTPPLIVRVRLVPLLALTDVALRRSMTVGLEPIASAIAADRLAPKREFAFRLRSSIAVQTCSVALGARREATRNCLADSVPQS